MLNLLFYKNYKTKLASLGIIRVNVYLIPLFVVIYMLAYVEFPLFFLSLLTLTTRISLYVIILTSYGYIII